MEQKTHSRDVRRATRPTPMLPKATTAPTPRLVMGVGAAFVIVAMLVLITHQLGADPTPLAVPAATRAPAARSEAPTRAPAVVEDATPLPTEPPAPAAVEPPAPMTGQGATWQDTPAVVEEAPAIVEDAPAAPLACQNAPAPEGVPICEESQPVFLREAVEDDCNAEHGRCSPPPECTAEHGRCTKGDGS